VAKEIMMILIADPHPESRAELSRTLADAGHRVVAVATGMEAAQVLIETRPSLIVLDLDLKWVTGWRLIDLLRRNDHLARIPVLVVSDVADGPPGIPVLTRPVETEVLLATVQRLWPAGAHVPQMAAH
jgi:CheY-like chemotaxis protein